MAWACRNVYGRSRVVDCAREAARSQAFAAWFSGYSCAGRSYGKKKSIHSAASRKVMGIYDRDYYRRDGSGFMVFANRGAVCKWLIGINVAVFLLQLVTKGGAGAAPGDPGFVTSAFALERSLVLEGQVWRLLTY